MSAVDPRILFLAAGLVVGLLLAVGLGWFIREFVFAINAWSRRG